MLAAAALATILPGISGAADSQSNRVPIQAAAAYEQAALAIVTRHDALYGIIRAESHKSEALRIVQNHEALKRTLYTIDGEIWVFAGA